ncbi:OsmC family protein [Aureimonas leprariae]|uniref:OsmC family protein n=1 Tax=Plantimonas leprariae TaxID=2615207 RepID=A0A7V7PM62_9HYPH|nr:OsmC family protein [Aureimonas leprariae]KAB0677601.1 OsmC family protein [Aureimonas leprariae]
MKRHATALWQGALADGKGQITTQSGALSQHPYSFKGRFEDESGRSGTNPEELLAAAHAGCFAMQLSHFLAENGTPATELNARSVVSIEQDGGGFSITSSAVTLEAKVPGIEPAKFTELANKAKEGCPVSKALGAISVTLDAKLV